jgi:hypothetical protein
MSKTHIVYIFWMLTITLLSVSSKSISNITEKTQDDRIMELENEILFLNICYVKTTTIVYYHLRQCLRETRLSSQNKQ